VNVLVLSGGDSPEREISKLSARSIVKALEKGNHHVLQYDPIDGYGGLEQFIGKVDVVFPILHGLNGEDGLIQKKLQDIGFNYLGSLPRSSEIAFNKVKTHAALHGSGIKMPRFEIMNYSMLEDMHSEMIGFAFVLKPISGGSSIDTIITKCATGADMRKAYKLVEKYGEMLYEELIQGTEVTVPVLGNVALPTITIVPPKNQVFDYKNKYNGATQEICPTPTDLVSEGLQDSAQKTALKVHELLGARHLSRVDMIIDKGGACYVLELNTMPGMTSQSLYPKSASVRGLDMQSLVEEFISLVQKEK
jgi:D-alanine-D-alanine ligase